VQQTCSECGAATGNSGVSPLSLGDLGPLCATCHTQLKCGACNGEGMVPAGRADGGLPENGGRALTVCKTCRGEAWLRYPAEQTPPQRRSKFTGPKRQKGNTAMPAPATPASESERERLVFGQNLRQARRTASLSRADVHKMTGLTPIRLARIEDGTADLCLDTMAQLSGAVGKPLWSLLKPSGDDR
jgi:hypothetical protein